jgi:tetratricopeptide (TPR) repeat protein
MTKRLNIALFLASALFAQTSLLFAQSRQIQQQPYWQGAWDKGIADYEMAREYGEAIEQFTTVIEAVPRFGEAYFRRGLAHTRLLHLQEAIKDFRQAIKIQPQLTTTYLAEINKYKKQDGNTSGLEAIFLVAAGRYNEAIFAFDQSLEQKIFTEDIVRLYSGMVALETGKNLAQGCQDCETAYNLGQTEVATQLLKKYCENKRFLTLTESVQYRQFIPRMANDSGVVRFAGSVSLTGIDSLVLEQSKNGVLQKRVAAPVRYATSKGETKAIFSLQTSIHAELSYYSFRFFTRSKRANTFKDSIITTADSVICGDVYVCSGQSNMVLGNVPDSPNRDFMRTYVFDEQARYWKTSLETNTMKNPNGRIGGFAGELQRLLVEQFLIPICMLNGAVNGSTMADHLVENPRNIRPKPLNEVLQTRIIRSGLQASVKAVFWYQGESSENNGYFDNFTTLTKDWKRAFPNLRTVYAAQIRDASCQHERDYDALRETQRRFPEKLPFVQTFATNAVPNYDGCHFNDAGYYALARQVFPLVARDFYMATDTINIAAPSVSKAFYSKADSTEITLEFLPASTILSTSSSRTIDSTTYYLHEAFTADIFANGTILRNQTIFSDIRVSSNKVMLTLAKPLPIKSVSYANDTFYRKVSLPYDGPWLVNVRGIGALSFYRVPISMP